MSSQEWLNLGQRAIERALKEAEAMFRRLGITFAVYGEEEASERLIPFDIIPRVFAASEWRRLSAGIEQRVRALNAFLHDIYHRQEILRAGRIPQELILQNAAFVPEMVGVNPVRGVYAHIIGIDIVRVGENEFYVLEDNCRTPSGVSYMLEDREAMMYLFPDLFKQHRVAPVENYPAMLRKTLESVAPPGSGGEPTIVLLTPGIHNSAFFEHAFLADEMGVELCEGTDLFVNDGWLYMRTTQEPKRVDVVYRRIDDAFLDPLTFRPDSGLGVPGLFDLYRAGRVTLVNAPGTGIADDKSIYTYMPDVIEFYTGEKPLLKNVPTWRCGDAEGSRLCARASGRAGGQGSAWLGRLRHAGRADLVAKEIEEFRAKLKARPANYIAQPTLALSASPTFTASGVAPRHIDLAALRAHRRPHPHHARRTDPGRAQERLARRQFEPGRRHQRHLGAGGLGMLGRTASSLFWMSRYVERAENMARLLEVGYRISLMPRAIEGHRDEWRSTLTSAACEQSYSASTRRLTTAKVIHHLLFDETNSSSVKSCLKTARNNGRAVRTALTRDVWESLNGTWNEFAQIKPATITADRLPGFLDWIKQRAMLFRGALLGTMLRTTPISSASSAPSSSAPTTRRASST